MTIIAALSVCGCSTTDAINVDANTHSVQSQLVGATASIEAAAFAPRNNSRSENIFLNGNSGSMMSEVRPQSANTAPIEKPAVTVNLLNATIEAAAKVILGDTLGYNYTVAPNIGGAVTMQTAHPVSKAELINLFQEALNANGCVILRTGDFYRIDRADQAKKTYNGIDIGVSPPEPERLGSGIRVVPLKFVAASEMKTVLEPIFGSSMITGVDNERNTLTISGTSQDIVNVLDAVSVFDNDAMKGMAFAVVPVKTVRPTAISDELKDIFSSGGTKGMVRFVPNDRLKTILVVSPQKDYLSRAASWIDKLDMRAGGQEKKLHTYKVQNRRAKELVDIVSNILTPARTPNTNEGSVSPRFDKTIAASSDNIASQGNEASGNINQIVNTGFTESSIGQDGIRVTADDANNALLVLCSSADYAKIVPVLQDIDVSPRQVMIEATILEVSLNDQMKFGVRWYFQNHESDLMFTNIAGKVISAAAPGFSYAFQSVSIQAAIDALNSVTHVNVLSAPSLMVLDNRTAKLQIGDQVPVVTQSAIGVQNSDSPIVNSVSYRDTGVILQLTPRINDSGRVLLDIAQEVSSVASTTSSGIDSPTIKQRKIETSVIVDDGQSLALGGIIQKQRERGNSQVPILGDIPLLGAAFKSKTDGLQKTELMVFITPRVVRNSRDSSEATAEYRDRLGFTTGHVTGHVTRHTMNDNLHRILY